MGLMPVLFTTEINLEGWPAMKKSDFNKAKKAAYFKVGKVWLRKFLPRHFRTGAKRRYGYPERSADHMRRKLALKGHRRPLVYKGDLELQVQSPSNQRVAATSKGVSVRLSHHQVHRQVREDLIKLDVAGEEQRHLEKVYQEELARQLNSFTGRRRIRLRK